jgi:DNA invertase Pin-like site-specific DNA recombinase
MPNADIAMLQIYAVMAEREARVIAERTKAALAAAKAKGTLLGANGRVLAEQHKADALVRVAPVADRLRALRADGLSLRRIADTLNGEGIPSPGGASWGAVNVQRSLARIST